jgi:hypothetical protein
MSTRPVPAAPPFGSELSTAPGGSVTTLSVPAWKYGEALRLSISSVTLKLAMFVSRTFSTCST